MPANDQVVIVHPDPQVRQAIRQVCATVHLGVIAYATADDLLDRPLPDSAGCLVLGLHLPGLSAVELLAELARREWVRPAVVVTAHADTRSVAEAMKAGVLDVFDLPAPPLLLLNAIQRALRMSPVIDRARVRHRRVTTLLQRLSPREREVLDRLMAGRTNKDIAREIGLSEKTVATHRNNVLVKMEVGSVVEAVRLIEPALTLPQIFLNPLASNPVDVLAAWSDSATDTTRGEVIKSGGSRSYGSG